MIDYYYRDDLVTLYNADTIDTLPEISGPLDAVITDPPYASGARTEAKKSSSGAMLRSVRWAAKPMDNDEMTTLGFTWLMRYVGRWARHELVEGGSFLSFIDWRQWANLSIALETTNLRIQGMVVWDKGSYGLGNGFRSQHELICHASKGTPRIYNKGMGNVLYAPRQKPDDHPSPKPVDLMRHLVSTVVPTSGLIVDPFSGSGTTLVAAKMLGIRSTGIEIEEKYAEVTARRLEQTFVFVGAAEPSPETISMFTDAELVSQDLNVVSL